MLDQPSSAMLGMLRSVSTAARLISAIDDAPSVPRSLARGSARRARASRRGVRCGEDERRALQPPGVDGLGSQVVLPAPADLTVCPHGNSTPSGPPVVLRGGKHRTR